MKRRYILPAVTALTLALAIVGLSTAQGPAPAGGAPELAVGTAFTYQGQLVKDGTPVTAVCDFRFSLWTSSMFGWQIGSDQIESLQVTDGLFTVSLNAAEEFTENPFTGEARYLNVEVMCPGDGGYVDLDPMQKLRPAPYAIGLALPYTAVYETDTDTDMYYMENIGAGRVMQVRAISDTAIWAMTDTGLAGVDGRSNTGSGVRGTSGYVGVWGTSTSSSNAVGVAGTASAAGCSASIGGCYGVQGSAANGYGVEGYTDGSGIGVHGYSNSASSVAIRATGQYGGNLIEAYHGPLFQDRKFHVADNGEVYADGAFNGGGSAMAALLPAADGLQPGDVLVVGVDGRLTRSTSANQAQVVGVYAGKAGFVGGAEDGEDTTGRVPLAVAGVVSVKVSAENGAIAPGDLLVTSATPGHAMKASAVTVDGITFYPSGVLLGKALGTLEGGTGEILMLVILH